MALAGAAVERSRGDQDPPLGQPGHGVPARLVAGGPEVERRLGVVDPEAGGLERRLQRRTTGRVAGVLLHGVLVVVERGDHRALLGTGHHQPEVLAYGEQLADDRRVPRDERAAVAREVGPLGQRVHGEDALVRAVADVGVQHRVGVGLPGALDVALVADQQHPALAAPGDHLAQVVLRQHPAGGVGRRVEPEQLRRARPDRGQRVAGEHVGAGELRRPRRRSGRRARGRRPGRRGRSRGAPAGTAISSFEPIDGITPSSPSPVTPWERSSQSMHACRVSGRPIVTG